MATLGIYVALGGFLWAGFTAMSGNIKKAAAQIVGSLVVAALLTDTGLRDDAVNTTRDGVRVVVDDVQADLDDAEPSSTQPNVP